MGCCIGKLSRDTATTEPIISQDTDQVEADRTTYHCSGQEDAETLHTSRTSAPTKFSLTMPQISSDLPPRPEFTSFTVPYLCKSRPYDGKDFWTYPECCGWIVHAKDTQCHVLCPPGACHHGMDVEEIDDSERRGRVKPPIFARSDGKPVLASDKVIFLQAWLFFGVLSEVSKLCGLEIDLVSEFVVDNDSISTTRLNGLSGRWYEAAVNAHRTGDKILMERILSIARNSRLMLSEELLEENTRMFQYTYSECRVLHSLDILVRVAGLHLLLHTYTPGFVAMGEEGWGHRKVLKSLDWDMDIEGMDQLSDFARDDLEEQGWCESELDLLAPQDLAFASLLPRPRIRDHSDCGDVICNAYQTDEATYQTRHMKAGCTCDFVSVATDVLVAALSEEKIPKLVVTEDLKVQVVSEHDYPYIALSHVWADGLGNAVSNALPRCQLRRLRDYTNYLSSKLEFSSRSPSLPVAFWVDTLCIPVDPSAKAYRKKAIKLLGRTFHEAIAVLILDRELEIVESATASFLELGLRILCSGWMKRLWTLQEATLASEARGAIKLYFQMQDGPFMYQKYDRDRKALQSLDECTTEIQAEERTLLVDRGIMLELGTQIPSVRAMRDMREGWSPFRVIYSAIERRSTSKFEDVPVCITSLLGKDLSSVVSASDAEQRMANFYLLMREIPIGVLWPERTERLSIAPFRWAPKSITGCPQTAYMGWEDVICDSAGLHVKLGGFVFTEQEIESGVMLPHVFNIVSADTGVVFGQLRGSPQRQKQIPFQRDLALIFRPSEGPEVLDPNALVVVVEATVDLGNNEREFVCRIIERLFVVTSRRVLDASFRGSMTMAGQRWCITWDMLSIRHLNFHIVGRDAPGNMS